MEIKAAFKQSDLGPIPAEWDVVSLGSVAEPLIGLTYSPRDVRDFGQLVLRSSNIQNGRLTFEDNVFVDMDVPQRAITQENDILICVRNGSRNLIGKCALIDKGSAGSAFGAFMSVLRSTSANFLFFQFQSQILKSQISEVMGATINQITNKDMAAFKVIWPHNEGERGRIAQALNDMDALLIAQDVLIAKKRDIKQAVMQQLLTGNQRLPGFSGEWEDRLLGSVGSFKKGKGIKKDEVLSDGIPCIRYGEIYTRHNDYIKSFYSFISRSIADQSQLLKRGDLLFAGSGETSEEIGKCVAFLSDAEAYAGGDIVIFSPVKQDSLYLGYLMNQPSIATQKSRMGQGDAVVHISATNLAQLQICLPPLSEQTAIAAVLSDMDTEIDALQQRRDKTLALKQGMMQELLTGRIRLV